MPDASAPPSADGAPPLPPLPAASVTVSASVVGTTPLVLGYNVAHMMPGSNAMDWWRYSGVKAARVFLSVTDIEPSDDLPGTGDGVDDRASFEARRAALRANAADPAQALDPQYVRWDSFAAGYDRVATGSNRFIVSESFPRLRGLGVEILANLTASPSRFPLAGDADWPNLWELWQHYYAEAFALSRDYDVRRFAMFNEPNGWTPAISVEDWELRLRVCSDAIQAGVADMNARYGRALVAEVFAPNTANGATKYDHVVDYWGQRAVQHRHEDAWGVALPSRLNFHVYNYQKYSMLTNDVGASSGYVEDIDALRAKIAADMPGVAPYPLALTEFNVRTGASYDGRPDTSDSPADYAALGANSVALSERGASQLYLFKFGQTARTAPTSYPVAKNGTHYVDNATSGSNPVGGASATAEVWRLFTKASGKSRERLAFTSALPRDVWIQVTRGDAANVAYVFVANKGPGTAELDIDLAALGLPEGSLVTTEEVSETHRGAIAHTSTLSRGRVAMARMPPESVWLVSVYGGAALPTVVPAAGDATLADGVGSATPGGAGPLLVRADGTSDGRRVAIVRFPLPAGVAGSRRVLLALQAGASAPGATVFSHLYGLEDDTWSETTATWAGLPSALKQGVAAGNQIASNVVAGQGATTRILGQLLVSSEAPTEKLFDVTDFVRAQTDGTASFLVVQDHRWDTRLPDRTPGDTQSAGVVILSRESATGPTLRIYGP